MDLDTLIANVKDKYATLIQKPKMNEKLLSKPPFRFLHDTISAVISTTGFGEGLYTAVEMDSSQIQEKQAKLDYLDKIFKLVGICKGFPLNVKSAKVVSGHEPEFTNEFLLFLAECATNPNLDSSDAVRRCLNGENPGAGPIPTRGGSLPGPSSESKSSNMDDESRQSRTVESKISESKLDDIPPAAERGKSRGGTRGGKPNQSTNDIGLTKPSIPNLDSEIERCDGTEATTQAMFADLITKPKLTEKLLSKPPFRFLFDIIQETIKVTGFGNGLYSSDESDSANITEKQQKITFLEKIIKVIGIHLNTIVEAKPARIIAGLDPGQTNNLLQLLAVAAKNAPDSRAAVAKVLDEMGGGSGTLEPPVSLPVSSDFNAPSQSSRMAPLDFSSVTASADAKPETSRAQMKSSREPLDSKSQISVPEIKSEDIRSAVQAANNEDINIEGDSDGKRAIRPTTARRRPPKVVEAGEAAASKDVAPVIVKKAEGIIVDGQGDDDDEDLVAEDKRLAEDVRLANRSAADAQSKLVQDIMSRQAEQEAANKTVSEPVVDEKADDNKGGGIRLRMRKPGSDRKAQNQGASAAAPATSTSGISATYSESDIDRLRSSIQLLVQHTGPLGTCMDFIQEDIGLMTSELHKWEDDCRKYELQLEEEKRKTQEKLQPLQSELAAVEEQIADQLVRISSTKAAIIKNDENIQRALKLITSA